MPLTSTNDHGGPEFFGCSFRALTGHAPFGWQARLFERFVNGDVPGVCRLPTGLGKTSVIPIWLIALCAGVRGARLPRRLVYIVNRRTVVDQATNDAKRLLACLYRSGQCDGLVWATEEAIQNLGLEAEPRIPDEHMQAARSLCTKLVSLCTSDPAAAPFVPLAVSTLRGELADNGEWKKNPACPAIIIGTIDMIGSKLLFSGYGDGRYGRAHHAGLIGQDALVVHDEAHLEPAFSRLLWSIEREQRIVERREIGTGGICDGSRAIRVMELSATSRADEETTRICDDVIRHRVSNARAEGSAGNPRERVGADASGGGAGDTSPASANRTPTGPFELTPEDERDDPVVNQRLHAKKYLAIRPVDGADASGSTEQLDAADAASEQSTETGGKGIQKKAKADLAAAIAGAAFEHEREKCRVLIYVRTPDLAKQISERLAEHLDLTPIKEKKDETSEARSERERKYNEREQELSKRVRVLTGTIRGHERDALAESDLFLAFKSNAIRSKPLPHTMYLVSTSAGEVGADWDADHLVCDLSTLDSMAQRFGRVNRLGGDGRRAEIVVILEKTEESKGEMKGNEKGKGKEKKISPLDAAIAKTGEVLAKIDKDGGDVSPAALGSVFKGLSDEDKNAAFSPQPTILPATDILFDHWSLTSIAGKMPGRPEVGPYLHGVAEWAPPETHIAWRADIGELAKAGGKDDEGKDRPCSQRDLEEVFNAFPLRSIEQLRDRSDRVLVELQKLAKRFPGQSVVVMKGGEIRWAPLAEFAPAGADKKKIASSPLAYATIVLPTQVGGLSANGAFDGNLEPPSDPDNSDAHRSLDVAEQPIGGKVDRQRAWVGGPDDADNAEPLLGGEIIDAIARHSVSLACGEDDEASQRAIEYRVVKGAEREPGARVGLDAHNSAVGAAAERIATALDLPRQVAEAVSLAARNHDTGKDREVWQRYAKNFPNRSMPGGPIAKSDRYGHWKMLGGYRHEFGSLLDAAIGPVGGEPPGDIARHPERDLILHLIAAHHGWARPHFEPRHFDPGNRDYPCPTAANERTAVEAMQRFARLQQRFGRWGLAWLESLVRCADAEASDTATPEGGAP